MARVFVCDIFQLVYAILVSHDDLMGVRCVYVRSCEVDINRQLRFQQTYVNESFQIGEASSLYPISNIEMMQYMLHKGS